jgi:hypothetical protein
MVRGYTYDASYTYGAHCSKKAPPGSGERRRLGSATPLDDFHLSSCSMCQLDLEGVYSNATRKVVFCLDFLLNFKIVPHLWNGVKGHVFNSCILHTVCWGSMYSLRFLSEWSLLLVALVLRW